MRKVLVEQTQFAQAIAGYERVVFMTVGVRFLGQGGFGPTAFLGQKPMEID